MSNIAGLFEIRDYKSEDKAFIKASFLKGLYYGDSWFSQIPKTIFMTNYSPILDHLIDRPTTIIKIACLKEDSDVILGYSILSNNYLNIHWVFVKQAWRKQGIGRALVPQYPQSVSHLTKLGKELLTKLNGAVFNPFQI